MPLDLPHSEYTHFLFVPHVMLDCDVFQMKSMLAAVHGADPVITPPVLEACREQVSEYFEVGPVYKGMGEDLVIIGV